MSCYSDDYKYSDSMSITSNKTSNNFNNADNKLTNMFSETSINRSTYIKHQYLFSEETKDLSHQSNNNINYIDTFLLKKLKDYLLSNIKNDIHNKILTIKMNFINEDFLCDVYLLYIQINDELEYIVNSKDFNIIQEYNDVSTIRSLTMHYIHYIEETFTNLLFYNTNRELELLVPIFIINYKTNNSKNDVIFDDGIIVNFKTKKCIINYEKFHCSEDREEHLESVSSITVNNNSKFNVREFKNNFIKIATNE